jgi:hypothetical protein
LHQSITNAAHGLYIKLLLGHPGRAAPMPRAKGVLYFRPKAYTLPSQEPT